MELLLPLGDAMVERPPMRGNRVVILTMGGIGLSSKDEAFETLNSLYEKRLAGFGDLLAVLVYEETGMACLTSRASAGVIEGHPVFSFQAVILLAVCRNC